MLMTSGVLSINKYYLNYFKFEQVRHEDSQQIRISSWNCDMILVINYFFICDMQIIDGLIVIHSTRLFFYYQNNKL